MPKPRFFTKLIPSITVTVLLLNLLAPVGLVFAQDGSPPADPPPTEEVGAADAALDEEPEDEQPVEDPAAEESPVEETQPTEEPPAEGESQEDSGSDLAGAAGTESEDASTEAETASSEEPAVEESVDVTEETEAEVKENPIAEAVEALDEADAVLLDEEGQALSMASQEAAAALTVPDPQFCPAGLAFGDAGCSPVQTTMAAAIADALAASTGGISGTIFVESGNFDGDGFGADIFIDGFNDNTSLTIQGNANGGGTTTFTTAFLVGTNNSNLFSSLTFNDVTFDMGIVVDSGNAADANTGDLSFNDVIANNAGGDGINVENHDGNINLDHVTANGTGDDGAELENLAGVTDHSVTVTNSTFNGNAEDGLEVDAYGQITITNVAANGNLGGSGNAGVDLDNRGTSTDAGITLTTVTVENNSNDGIIAYSDGTITLNNVNANNNDDDGAVLYNDWNPVDSAVNVFNSNFNGNGATAADGVGLDISSYGTVTLNTVSASNNTGSSDANFGAFIDNTGLGNDAAVNITNSVFNGNIGVDEGTGLEIYSDGQITLNNVQANNNQATAPGGGAFGAILDNSCGCTGNGVTITDSSFSNNSGDALATGLTVASGGSITLNGVAANGNTSANGDAAGAFLDNGNFIVPDIDAPVTVLNSSFNNNMGATDGYGLLVYSQGNITLSHVSASGNSVDGVDLQIDSGNGPENISIYCSFMQNNGEVGIYIDGGGGDLTIQSTDTSGNGVAPLDIINVANTVFGQIDCDPDKFTHDKDGKHAPLDPNAPTNITLDLYPHSVTFPPMNLLECTGYVKSLFYASDLPAELYAGDDFLRAMKIRIENCDIPDGGMFTIGFDIPAAEQGNEFVILFWDSGTASWVEIPGQLTVDGRYTASWPTTGTFVLVTR